MDIDHDNLENEYSSQNNLSYNSIIDDAIDDVIQCVNMDSISGAELNQKITSLNPDQRRVFEGIRKSLEGQKLNDPNAKILRKFISGTGGLKNN